MIKCRRPLNHNTKGEWPLIYSVAIYCKKMGRKLIAAYEKIVDVRKLLALIQKLPRSGRVLWFGILSQKTLHSSDNQCANGKWR